MILNMSGGGGGGKVTVTVQGAPGETVTYSGTAAGSLVLDADGNATALLKRGTYTFKGSLSGYSMTCAVTGAQTVGVYPAGAIYWYGREDLLCGQAAAYAIAHKNRVGNQYSRAAPTLNRSSNAIQATEAASRGGCMMFKKAFTAGQWTMIKAKATSISQTLLSTQDIGVVVAPSLDDAVNTTAYKQISSAGTVAADLGGGGYAGIELANSISVTIAAIWLE